MSFKRTVLFALLFMLALACAMPVYAATDLTRNIRLAYLEPDDALMVLVSEYLGPGGRAALLKGTRSLVVTGTPAGVARVEALIREIDMRPEQLLIEARIVEVSKSGSMELGINWAGTYSRPAGDIYAGRPGVVGGSVGVNMPANAEYGGSIGYGFVTDRHMLDMRLSALEQKDKARIVSSPSIIVMENQRAVISEGEEFIVPKREQSTYINTESPDPEQKPVPETYSALLKLAVVPRIIEQRDANAEVAMSVEVRREVFDHERQIEGFPPKLLRSALTELMVQSGKTVVIGGISTEGERDSTSGVPLLSRIPVLGWLFKGKASTKEDRELMIFITPTVLKEAPAELTGR